MSTLNSDSVDQSVGSYSFIHDHKPCKGDSSSPGLVPDARWWLNHQKGYSLDQLNVLEADAKSLAAAYANDNTKAPAENKLIEDYCNIDPKIVAAFCSDIPFQSTISEDLLSNAHLMGLDSCSCLLFERPEKLCSDLDSHWIGVEKIEPWWHAVDEEDLASLVSQTSSHHVRNLNHPAVQSMHGEKLSGNCGFCFDQLQEQIIGKGTKAPHVTDCIQGNLASASKDKSLGKQELMESNPQDSDQTFRSSDGFNTGVVDSEDPSGDLSRAELLVALCHSQTRAREAEKMAQKACDEKNRVVNIFFQQASRLFAYRQWLRMLQLETLCLHLSSMDQLPSVHPPSMLPWVENKGGMLKKNGPRAAKKELGKKRRKVSKCAIAFAIGLSLAGAGLLVGWTIGWLFPAL